MPEKPKIGEYRQWLLDQRVDAFSVNEAYYAGFTSQVKAECETAPFWTQIGGALERIEQEYQVQTGYPLLVTTKAPEFLIKPFASFMEKSYRRNIATNRNWPKPPPGGWVLPDNWFHKTNDIIRTVAVVKYLDGAEFLSDKLRSYFAGFTLTSEVAFEAREEGYYAVHLYVSREFRIPLSANMSETGTSLKFSVEGEQGLEVDERDREGSGGSRRGGGGEGNTTAVHAGLQAQDPARGGRL